MNLEKVKSAAEVIKAGGLVVYPSDTVYILAVDPTKETAVKKLLEFKNRWTGKAISIAVLDKKMAQEYVNLSPNAENIYANLLPGPFTVVSEGKHKTAPGIEAENGTLGIRIPDSPWISELINLSGRPVTATSANLSGRTPHYSVESFVKTLSKKKLAMIDMIVDAGKLPKNKPSTVIDATEPEIKILRRGDLVTRNSQTLVSKSERETEKIAEFIFNKIAKKSDKPLVMGLSGDLGSGKTVFSRAIGKILGVKEKITSPTFVIFNEYKINNGFKKYVHMDLYRLTAEYEYEEIKFLEQFGPGTIACVEWPENMGENLYNKLKKTVNYIPINFRYINESTREISF